MPRGSNQFGQMEIEDDDLQPGDIPVPDADWPELWRFALTIDGYERLGSFEAVAELGNRVAATFARQGELPRDLRTLRLALFFEQRRYHHSGDVPSGDPASYVRALIGAIGEAVAQARSSEPTGIPPASADVQQRFEQLGIELPPVPVRFAGDLRAFEVSPTGKGPDADQ